jgi:hypothetical protein
VAVENNARPGFFLGGKDAVVIRVQQADDGVVSFFSAPVFKNLNIGVFGNASPHLLRELYRAMMRIVMVDKTAHETDHYVGSGSRRLARDSRAIRSSRIPSHIQNRQSDEQCNERRAK